MWALKQFREATILVRNNATAVPASAIRFENVTAHLNLPAGLVLPDLNGASQPLTQALGTLNAAFQVELPQLRLAFQTPTVVDYDAFSNVTRLEIDLGDLPSGATAGARFSLILHVTGRIGGVETQVWNNTTASPPVEAAAEYPGTPPTAPNGGCLMLTGVNVPTSAADAAYVKTLPASPTIQTLVVRLDTTNPAF